jgi:thymidylate kinase
MTADLGVPGVPLDTAPDVSGSTGMTVAGAAFEASGIRWCLLRGDPAARRGDLDLLVHPDDSARAALILARSGFARLRDRHGNPGRSWAAGPRTDGAWERIDFRTELDFGGQRLRLDRDGLLRCTTVEDGMRRPDDGDEFWTLLFHSVLDADACGSDHAPRLVELAGRAPASAGSLGSTRPPITPRALEELVRLARQGAWHEVHAVVARLVGGGRSGRGAVGRGWRRVRRLARLVRGGDPSGFSVAILGPDGVGKTTICRAVARAYLRPVVQVSVGRKLRSHSVWGRVARPVRRAVRFVAFLETCGRAWAGRRRGRVVLWDRHPDDPAVRGARVRSRRWARRLAPDPDLVVVLDAPAEVIRARKEERDVAELEALRRAYLAMAASATVAEIVDASSDLTTVRDAVTAALWRHDPARTDDPSDRALASAPERDAR